MKTIENKTVGSKILKNGTMRDVRTVGANHINVCMSGSFSCSLLRNEAFGDIIVDGGAKANINLEFANPDTITPPLGFKLVKVEKD
jgi:hypothetical protein